MKADSDRLKPSSTRRALASLGVHPCRFAIRFRRLPLSTGRRMLRTVERVAFINIHLACNSCKYCPPNSSGETARKFLCQATCCPVPMSEGRRLCCRATLSPPAVARVNKRLAQTCDLQLAACVERSDLAGICAAVEGLPTATQKGS